MATIKDVLQKKAELCSFILIYIILFSVAFVAKDSSIALISAFCGITYTILAGKGYPACYLIGVLGSGFYSYLAFLNHFWGNLALYFLYYIPMQILGFFKWNKNLDNNTNKIVKISLTAKERILYLLAGCIISAIVILFLIKFSDKNPFIDGITTVFSVIGLLLTVKRCIEQWVVWMLVNGLSLLMWLQIALQGEKVYSTVIMWAVYFVLSVYFYIDWRNLQSKAGSKKNIL